MQKRQLGNSGIYSAPVMLGGNVFGWTVDEPTSLKLLDAFIESGLNAVDTADVYSMWVPGHKGGESEELIGKWLKHSGKRSRVVIATKVGMPLGPDKKGLSKRYIRQAAEDSLRRLQTDYIDLYQAHQDDRTAPLEETLEAFAELIEQGKVRAIGASNYKADRLEEALEVSREKGLPRYESLQPWYNLYDRQEYETMLEPICEGKSLGVIPYYSLASGFLTGKYRSKDDLSKSPRGGSVEKYLNDRGFRILRALDEVAQQHNSRLAQVALAWLIARPSITASIASATNLDQLRELVEATQLQLNPQDIQKLNRASAY